MPKIKYRDLASALRQDLGQDVANIDDVSLVQAWITDNPQYKNDVIFDGQVGRIAKRTGNLLEDLKTAEPLPRTAVAPQRGRSGFEAPMSTPFTGGFVGGEMAAPQRPADDIEFLPTTYSNTLEGQRILDFTKGKKDVESIRDYFTSVAQEGAVGSESKLAKTAALRNALDVNRRFAEEQYNDLYPDAPLSWSDFMAKYSDPQLQQDREILGQELTSLFGKMKYYEAMGDEQSYNQAKQSADEIANQYDSLFGEFEQVLQVASPLLEQFNQYGQELNQLNEEANKEAQDIEETSFFGKAALSLSRFGAGLGYVAADLFSTLGATGIGDKMKSGLMDSQLSTKDPRMAAFKAPYNAKEGGFTGGMGNALGFIFEQGLNMIPAIVAYSTPYGRLAQTAIATVGTSAATYDEYANEIDQAAINAGIKVDPQTRMALASLAAVKTGLIENIIPINKFIKLGMAKSFADNAVKALASGKSLEVVLRGGIQGMKAFAAAEGVEISEEIIDQLAQEAINTSIRSQIAGIEEGSEQFARGPIKASDYKDIVVNTAIAVAPLGGVGLVANGVRFKNDLYHHVGRNGDVDAVLDLFEENKDKFKAESYKKNTERLKQVASVYESIPQEFSDENARKVADNMLEIDRLDGQLSARTSSSQKETIEKKITKLQNEINAIYQEEQGRVAPTATQATPAETSVPTELQVSESDQNVLNLISERIEPILNPLAQRMTNAEEIEMSEIESVAEQMIDEQSRILASENLSEEDKQSLSQLIESQIDNLLDYEFATITTTEQTGQARQVKGVVRFAKPGLPQKVSTDRFFGTPVTNPQTGERGFLVLTKVPITQSRTGLKYQFVSEAEMKRQKNGEYKAQQGILKLGDEVAPSTPFTNMEYVSSNFGEDGNLTSVVLRDAQSGTELQIDDQELALDIAIAESQKQIGTVPQGALLSTIQRVVPAERLVKVFPNLRETGTTPAAVGVEPQTEQDVRQETNASQEGRGQGEDAAPVPQEEGRQEGQVTPPAVEQEGETPPATAKKPRKTAQEKTDEGKAIVETLKEALRALKAKPDGGANIDLTFGVVPITKAVWNTAIDTAILAIDAGQSIAQAVKAASDYISSKIEGDWGKAKAEKYMENQLSGVGTSTQIDDVANSAGISPKNFRDLYRVNRELFGLNQAQAMADAIAMDRMINVMAKRAGITKEEMYGRLKFEKSSKENLAEGVKFQVDAWHGSPYQFDKFKTENIGTGEGQAAFGWGLYFTSTKKIAEFYAKKLAKSPEFKYLINDKAPEGYIKQILDYFERTGFDGPVKANLINYIKDDIQEYRASNDTKSLKEAEDALKFIRGATVKTTRPKRNLYKVSLQEGKTPDQYTWLEWSSPIGSKVKDIVKKNEAYLKGLISDTYLSTKAPSGTFLKESEVEKNKILDSVKDKILDELINSSNGKDFYNRLSRILASDEQASLFLLENGIDGVKYSAGTRTTGPTSKGFNYVVFDENAISIEKVIKFQEDAIKARGAVMVSMDGRATIYALSDPNVSTPLHELAHVFEHYLTDEERSTVQQWAKTKDWNIKTSESFARGFEKYLAEGKAPTPALQKIFDNFKQWLTDIYRGIVGSDIDIELNKPMRDLYAKMFEFTGEDGKPQQQAQPEAQVEATAKALEKAVKDNPAKIVQEENGFRITGGKFDIQLAAKEADKIQDVKTPSSLSFLPKTLTLSHLARSKKDKNNILKNGFDINQASIDSPIKGTYFSSEDWSTMDRFGRVKEDSLYVDIDNDGLLYFDSLDSLVNYLKSNNFPYEGQTLTDSQMQKLKDNGVKGILLREDFASQSRNELIVIDDSIIKNISESPKDITKLPSSFSNIKEIAEAYHKAKADGSGPKLVQAVEDLLGQTAPEAKPEKTISEQRKEFREAAKKYFEGMKKMGVIFDAERNAAEDIAFIKALTKYIKLEIDNGMVTFKGFVEKTAGMIEDFNDASVKRIARDIWSKEVVKAYPKIYAKLQKAQKALLDKELVEARKELRINLKNLLSDKKIFKQISSLTTERKLDKSSSDILVGIRSEIEALGGIGKLSDEQLISYSELATETYKEGRINQKQFIDALAKEKAETSKNAKSAITNQGERSAFKLKDAEEAREFLAENNGDNSNQVNINNGEVIVESVDDFDAILPLIGKGATFGGTTTSPNPNNVKRGKKNFFRTTLGGGLIYLLDKFKGKKASQETIDFFNNLQEEVKAGTRQKKRLKATLNNQRKVAIERIFRGQARYIAFMLSRPKVNGKRLVIKDNNGKEIKRINVAGVLYYYQLMKDPHFLKKDGNGERKIGLSESSMKDIVDFINLPENAKVRELINIDQLLIKKAAQNAAQVMEANNISSELFTPRTLDLSKYENDTFIGEILNKIYNNAVPSEIEYFPSNVESDANSQVPEVDALLDQEMDTNAVSAMSRFMIERVSGGKVRIKSYDAQLGEYFDSMSNTASKLPILKRFQAVFNKENSNLISSYYGKNTTDELRENIGRYITSRQQDSGLAKYISSGPFSKWLASGLGVQMVFAFTSAFSQLSSTPGPILSYGVKNYLDGLLMLTSGEVNARRAIVDLTDGSLFRERFGSRIEVADIVKAIPSDETGFASYVNEINKKLISIGAIPSSAFDALSIILSLPIYAREYSNALKTMTRKEAADYAENVLMDKAENFLQSKSDEMMSSFESKHRTTLYAFATVVPQLQRQAIMAFKRIQRGEGDLAQNINVLVWSGIGSSVAFRLLRPYFESLFEGDDDDEELKKLRDDKRLKRTTIDLAVDATKSLGTWGAISAGVLKTAYQLAEAEGDASVARRALDITPEVLEFVPAVSIKVSSINNAIKSYYDDEDLRGTTQAIQALTNIPAEKARGLAVQMSDAFLIDQFTLGERLTRLAGFVSENKAKEKIYQKSISTNPEMRELLSPSEIQRFESKQKSEYKSATSVIAKQYSEATTQQDRDVAMSKLFSLQASTTKYSAKESGELIQQIQDDFDNKVVENSLPEGFLEIKRMPSTKKVNFVANEFNKIKDTDEALSYVESLYMYGVISENERGEVFDILLQTKTKQ